MAEGTFKAGDHNKVITLGLPLPSFIEHITDVSEPTRTSIEKACDYLQKHTDLEVFEVKKRGINVSANHNDLVNSMKGDWLLICGSDHAFPSHAIHELWKATQVEPYPKIIGGVMPYRNPPHAYVFSHLNNTGELLYPMVPYKHFHPGITMSGEIMKVDVIGSGFTMYHRSVFDAVPPPWFSYEPLPFNDKKFYETLENFDGNRSFADFIEDVASGKVFVTPEQREVLKDKARGIRRILGQSRRHVSFGPDFGFCIKAKDHGFDSYVHWGLDILHSTFVPINNGYYIANMSDPRSWFNYAIGGEELSMDGLAKDVEMLKKLNFNGIDPDALMKEYEESKLPKEEAV